MAIRIILPLLAVVNLARGHDVNVGQNVGRKIFDESLEASPALWRQVQNVTVSTNDSEVISRVVVKDNRPEKDGDAKIVEGGEGQKNVTIELKSPTVLRGYNFHIEVYAVEEGLLVINPAEGKDQQGAHGLNNQGHDFNHPRPIRDDKKPEDINSNVPIEPNFNQPKTNQHPHHQSGEADIVRINVKDTSTPKPNPSLPVAGTNSEKKTNDKVNNPVSSSSVLSKDIPPMLDGDLKTNHGQARHVRDTQSEQENARFRPYTGKHTEGATPITDRSTKNIQDKLHEHKTDENERPSFIPLNVARDGTKKPETENNHGFDKYSTLPAKTNEATSTTTEKSTKATESKPVTTEKPRNIRDTHDGKVTEVKNVPTPSVPVQDPKPSPAIPRSQDDIYHPGASRDTHGHAIPQFQPYPGLIPNASSSTTPKTTTPAQKGTTSAESDEDDHDFQRHNVKGIPKTSGKDTAQQNGVVKPVISIQ